MTRRKKKSIKFIASTASDGDKFSTVGDLTDNIRSAIEEKQKIINHQQRLLAKAVKPTEVRSYLKKKNDRSKIVFSSRSVSDGFNGVEEKGWRRLSDHELKEISQIDPYISAIISTRCSQGQIIGNASESKFDKGTRIVELDPLDRSKYPDNESFQEAAKVRKNQMNAILRWILNCGTSDQAIIDSAFAGADPLFKKCTLSDFLSAQIRNLLTFGRCYTQIFRDENGIPVMFRPVPAETIRTIAPGSDVSITGGDDTSEQSIEDAKEYNSIQDRESRPIAYVQRVEGNDVNLFTERDLKVTYFQKQALFDLRSYPLSPIEQAIYMVYTHQQTLGYLRNGFVKGIGAKSLISIESTDPSAQISDSDLDEFKKEFHNFVSRNDNSATTPVISGPVRVNVIPLNPTPKDMEFLQVEEHIIRALCSAMQISPQEMGYGHLSIGQGGLTQANKQEEIVRGEERGLRMVLDQLYALLNEILYENFPEAEKTYKISYTGVGEDTRDAVIGRHMSELHTTATMASLYADSEKRQSVPYGGNVPLSPTFHSNVVRYMKYGVFMEHFFGEQGASQKPEYDFIIDPGLNQSYQQLKSVSLQLQAQEAQGGSDGQTAEDGQNSEDKSQADVKSEEGSPEPQKSPEEPTDDAAAPDQEPVPTLAEEYKRRQQLKKSMVFYFRDWIKAHEEK